ncbi:cyclin PHO80-like protein, partial [Kipferlia bialata]
EKGLRLTRNNVYRMLLVAVMVASKTLEDSTYRNCDWAIIGLRHYSCAALGRMELEMLVWLGFRTNVPREKFMCAVKATFGHHPVHKCLPRPVSERWREEVLEQLAVAV